MILQQIVRSCTNAHVARAALASIGGDFAEHFAAEELRWNLPPGMLTTLIVKGFWDQAGLDQRENLSEAAHGADQPILSGPRYILSQSALLR